jgi:CHRD domain-containing protein/PEP-CTERM motif-containing protein
MKLRAVLAGCILAASTTLAAAHEESFSTILTGAAESRPNASPGTAEAEVTFDFDLFTMHIKVSFQDLAGAVSAAHIHCCTTVAGAGIASIAIPFSGFPTGVTSGSFDQAFDMTLASSYDPTFITANGGTISTASNALFGGVEQGKAYVNIHTDAYPGGEIRGFLAPVLVPEPEIYAFLSVGLGLLAVAARRRHAARV